MPSAIESNAGSGHLFTKEFSIDETTAGRKLRAFILTKLHETHVRADIITILRQNRVRVNGEIMSDTYILQPHDSVQVDIDNLEAIKGRLRGIDVQVKHKEPGLMVLLKSPGINKQAIEWAGAALEMVSDAFCGEVPESNKLVPWIAVNCVEKAIRSLVILVNSQRLHQVMLDQISSGQVMFTISALCHGKVEQTHVDKTTAESLASAANATLPHTSEEIPYLHPYLMWFKHNDLRFDIFDHVRLNVVSVTESSTAGYLSMVSGKIACSINPGLVLRRLMLELGYPVAGNQSHAKPLSNHRDKGSLLAFTSIEFLSPNQPTNIVVSEDVPPKLTSVCVREAKFFVQKQERAQKEISNMFADTSETDGLDDGLTMVNGKPAAYVTGRKQFCGYIFGVTPDTLIPRPSTETLVATVVELVDQKSAKILDLGTGSGCILLSVLLQTANTSGIGVDISSSALSVAQANSSLHRMGSRATFIQSTFSSFASELASCGPFDIIACNPPYVSASKITRMREAMEHEPLLAFVAEDGGYQFYRDIHSCLSANLSILTGSIAFEIGKNMEKGVRRIFADWTEVAAKRDSRGYLRVLVFKPPS
ncbi:hypothetical protein LPJ79_005367 [Coemansia sp. RSA 1821]|nr:hypothetical protein LPJ68_005210 [Coemansia sp. RSA 1086]KAJ1747270.1 hypothetical protein LPJ79_005367 [Coemansia sp. RSA 1821]